MATSTARFPNSRRSSSIAGPTAASIARGATARSAVSPKVNASLNGINRRGSLSARPISLSTANHDDGHAAREGLAAALKRETEEKEELLVRIQNKDQNISELKKENTTLTTNLNTAETRLAELYADQARAEEETVARLELVDRLRAQIQEIEREKREVLRRYNEQTATFDAERQSFYDNEQHLKSRIQSLIQARKAAELLPKPSIQSFAETITDDGTMSLAEEFGTSIDATGSKTTESDDEDEPAEMTALRLELSTLSTSYSSLQNTVQLLSSQLLDLKRVNNQLQEENESYNILLREKTLNGQFDILKSVGAKEVDSSSTDEDDNCDDAEDYDKEDHTSRGARTPLDPVDELAEDMDSAVYGEEAEQDTLVQDDTGSLSSSENRDKSRRTGRGGRRVKNSSSSPPPKGESLADLPVAGPGLDLAAELGRAENQAIIDGTADPTTRDRSSSNAKGKRGKRSSIDKKASEAKLDSSGDLDALRNEVKSLKDANKALSLYASKIIDRIIAQEGFEHVLAADYEKPPPSPVKKQVVKKPSVEETKPKPRPQSAIFGLAFPSSEPPVQPSQPNGATVNDTLPPYVTEKTTRTQRRSMSFDWKGFSMFGGSSEKKTEPNPNLRPLSLRPGATSVVSARKLDTTEDDEDRRERERLHATMKLMGINKPMTSAPPTPSAASMANTTSTSPNPQSEVAPPKSAIASRFSFFRSRSTASDVSPNTPTQASTQSGHLTAEALERAEAVTTLAALDEREKVLSAEIAKGSHGGFTELPSRRQRGEGRSRKSRKSGGSGSGSTVWSAGMSTHREEDSD